MTHSICAGSWFAEKSRIIETPSLSQSNFLNYHSSFVVLTRTAGMECSLLPSPDVLTALTQSSSPGTKQEENTDCMGYLLRAMTKFLVRGRQLYFRKAQQAIIVVKHMEEENSNCSSVWQIPNKFLAARNAGVHSLSDAHHLQLKLFCFV